MDQVPKILKPMVDEWARDGFVVSFKVLPPPCCILNARQHRHLTTLSLQLETDETLIIPKARAALERYGHQVVIGNDLHSRKYRVVFVSRQPPAVNNDAVKANPADGRFTESWLHIDTPSSPVIGHTKEIEEDIVAELVRQHTNWINVPI